MEVEKYISVGIDIGTTTTQIIFSSISYANTASMSNVPSINMIEDHIMYAGKIYLTPIKNDEIDADVLKRMLENEYNSASLRPEDVKIGAVILTGESAKRENARKISDLVSRYAGDFVVSSAGPDIEAIIAGKGCGAEKYSRRHKCRVLNLDIGGGTTNAVVFDNGTVVSSGCIDIGGRHVLTDKYGNVTAISDTAKKLMVSAGIQQLATEEQKAALVNEMVQSLLEFAGFSYRTGKADKLITRGSNILDAEALSLDAVCFSGGVADAVYGTCDGLSDYHYGDIGILLGKAIADSDLTRKCKIIKPVETIRATVVGAGTYSITVSGSTVCAGEKHLPMRNLSVLYLDNNEIERITSGDAEYLAEKISWLKNQIKEDNVVIAFDGRSNPEYRWIKAFAVNVAKAAEKALGEDVPIVVIIKTDMAKAFGQALFMSTKKEIIVLDGIAVKSFDKIDIGRHVAGMAVAVNVKTLLFGH